MDTVTVDPNTARLFDYFAIVKTRELVPQEPEEGSASPAAAAPTGVGDVELEGVVTFRWPLDDHMDSPFLASLPFFIFPSRVRSVAAQLAPDLFSFVGTSDTGTLTLGICLRFYEPRLLAGVAAPATYAPAALCLLTRWPFFRQGRALLSALLRWAVDGTPHGFPYECLLSHVLQGIPLPPPGRVSVRTNFLGPSHPPLCFQRPAPNARISPMNHGAGLRLLLLALSPSELLRALTALALEHQLCFISPTLSLLTPVCLALTTLMYPFRWRHTLIPVLPSALLTVMEAPMPFLVGVHTASLDAQGDFSQIPSAVHVFHLAATAATEGGAPSPPPPPLPSLPEKPGGKLFTALSELSHCAHTVFRALDLSSLGAVGVGQGSEGCFWGQEDGDEQQLGREMEGGTGDWDSEDETHAEEEERHAATVVSSAGTASSSRGKGKGGGGPTDPLPLATVTATPSLLPAALRRAVFRFFVAILGEAGVVERGSGVAAAAPTDAFLRELSGTQMYADASLAWGVEGAAALTMPPNYSGEPTPSSPAQGPPSSIWGSEEETAGCDLLFLKGAIVAKRKRSALYKLLKPRSTAAPPSLMHTGTSSTPVSSPSSIRSASSFTSSTTTSAASAGSGSSSNSGVSKSPLDFLNARAWRHQWIVTAAPPTPSRPSTSSSSCTPTTPPLWIPTLQPFPSTLNPVLFSPLVVAPVGEAVYGVTPRLPSLSLAVPTSTPRLFPLFSRLPPRGGGGGGSDRPNSLGGSSSSSRGFANAPSFSLEAAIFEGYLFALQATQEQLLLHASSNDGGKRGIASGNVRELLEDMWAARELTLIRRGVSVSPASHCSMLVIAARGGGFSQTMDLLIHMSRIGLTIEEARVYDTVARAAVYDTARDTASKSSLTALVNSITPNTALRAVPATATTAATAPMALGLKYGGVGDGGGGARTTSSSGKPFRKGSVAASGSTTASPPKAEVAPPPAFSPHAVVVVVVAPASAAVAAAAAVSTADALFTAPPPSHSTASPPYSLLHPAYPDLCISCDPTLACPACGACVTGAYVRQAWCRTSAHEYFIPCPSPACVHPSLTPLAPPARSKIAPRLLVAHSGGSEQQRVEFIPPLALWREIASLTTASPEAAPRLAAKSTAWPPAAKWNSNLAASLPGLFFSMCFFFQEAGFSLRVMTRLCLPGGRLIKD